MKSVRPQGSLWLVGIGCAMLTMGCSLILDPTTCEDDSECNGGVCQSGVCVGGMDTPDEGVARPDRGPRPVRDGGEEAGMTPADTGVVDAEADPDVSVPEAGMEMGVSPDADSDPDMGDQPDPQCEFLEPAEGNDRISAGRRVQLRVRVTDENHGPDELEVRINGVRDNLDDAGELTYNFQLEEEGGTLVTLTAEDPEGGTCETSITLVLDRTAPVIEMLRPIEGSMQTTNLPVRTVTGRVVDAHFVPSLTVAVNDVAVADEDLEVEWTENTFEVSVPIDPGANTVSLSATDLVENVGTPVSFQIVYDNENPVVRLTDPPQDQSTAYFEEVIPVTGTVTDGGEPVSRASVIITVAGPEAGQRAEFPTVGNRRGEFSQRIQLFDGANALTVCGRDGAGNEHCVNAEAIKSDQRPCVSITDPQPGGGEVVSFFSVGAATISGTACRSVESVALSVFRCPNGPQADCNDPLPAQQNVPADLADEAFSGRIQFAGAGYYEVRAVAANGEGETANDATRVQLDNTAPRVQISAPRANECQNSLEVRVCASFSDDETAINRLSINGDEYDLPAGGAFCENVLFRDDGEVDLDVQVRNQAGLRGEATRALRIDRDIPEVYLDDPSGEAALVPWFGPTGDEVIVRGSVNAGLCPTVRFSIDGSPVSIDAQTQRFSYGMELEEGLQDVSYAITDEAGNQEPNGGFTFNVDLSAPVIDNAEPADGSYTAEPSVNLTVQVEDACIEGVEAADGGVDCRLAGSGVVAATIDGVQLLPVPLEAPFRMGADFDLVEGQNEFDFTATDLVGNQQTRTIRIFRDTIRPTVRLIWPTAGDPATFPLTVWLEAEDDGSGLETVTVNETPAVRIGESSIYRVDLVPLDLADPAIEIRAVDATGNEAVPINEPVNLRAFGAPPSALEGLDTAGAVSWTDGWDVDGDALTDLVVLTSDSAQSSAVYLQTADGRFEALSAAAAGFPENISLRDAALGDVDADGRMDLVMVGDVRTVVARGAAQGRFVLGQSGLLSTNAPRSISLADVNRDGHLDALLSAGVEQTRLFFNNGDGTFASEQLNIFGLQDLPNFAHSRAVDVNGDAVVDVLAWGPDGAALYIGDRDSGFARHGGALLTADPVDAVAVFDADRNGTLDFLLGSADGAQIYVVDAQGEITLSDRPVPWEVGDVGVIPFDADADTRDDLLVYGANGIRILRNQEAGFAVANSAALGLPDLGAVTSAQAIDFDRDGDVDIIAGGANGLRIIRNNAVGRTEVPVVTLDIRREKQPDPPEGQTERDAVGTVVLLDYDAGPELGAQRAVIPHPAGPTPITVGDAQRVNIGVRFTDKGGRGSNVRGFVDMDALVPGESRLIFGRE